MQMPQKGAGGGDQRRGKEEEEEELVLATWDCGSPLYDSFELSSLHYVLESHLMVLPFPGAAVSHSRRFYDPGVIASPDLTDRDVARRRRTASRTRKAWTGSKAAAAVLRAITCWKSL